jgi:hypothetical protein
MTQFEELGKKKEKSHRNNYKKKSGFEQMLLSGHSLFMCLHGKKE